MYVTRAHTLVTYVSSEQGLGSLYHADEEERRCQEQYSLISKGCMIVHVPRNRFLQLADAETLERVRRDVRHYPSELQLRHQFVANSLWDTCKQVICFACTCTSAWVTAICVKVANNLWNLAKSVIIFEFQENGHLLLVAPSECLCFYTKHVIKFCVHGMHTECTSTISKNMNQSL